MTANAQPRPRESSPESRVPVQAQRDHSRQRRYADWIPESLIEHFHSKNQRVRWGAKDEIQQSMDSSLGWAAVDAGDLKGEMLELAKDSFTPNPDGTFTRGDMILQWRSENAHQEQMDEEAEQRSLMEDPRRQIGDFEEAAQSMGFTPFGPGTHVPDIADNVVTGLSEDTLEAARAVERILAERAADTPSSKSPDPSSTAPLRGAKTTDPDPKE